MLTLVTTQLLDQAQLLAASTTTNPPVVVVPVVSDDPWCTYDDLLTYATVLSTMNKLKAADTSGFLGIRRDNTASVRRDLTKRYDPIVGLTRVRQPLATQPFGFDWPDPTAQPPSHTAYTTALLTGGLILEEDIREIVARRSIADVLDRQGPSYAEEAQHQRMMAQTIYSRYEPLVDANRDGVADYLVTPGGRQVIILPAGALP